MTFPLSSRALADTVPRETMPGRSGEPVEDRPFVMTTSPLSAVDGVQQLQQQPLLSYSGVCSNGVPLSPEQQYQQQTLLASPPTSTLKPYVSVLISIFPIFTK